MKETTQTLMDLACKQFKVDRSSLHPDDDFFEKLQINSLTALSFLSDLERVFQVEIPDYELADVKTFQDLACVIDRRK